MKTIERLVDELVESACKLQDYQHAPRGYQQEKDDARQAVNAARTALLDAIKSIDIKPVLDNLLDELRKEIEEYDRAGKRTAKDRLDDMTIVYKEK